MRLANAQIRQVPMPSTPNVGLFDFHDRSFSRDQKLSQRALEERQRRAVGVIDYTRTDRFF
jgi:hypothetical protein